MTRPKTLTGIFGRVSSKCMSLVYAGHQCSYKTYFFTYSLPYVYII